MIIRRLFDFAAGLLQVEGVAVATKRDLVLNVKDYGATGLGITDDRPAINSAIDACNAAGGGVVFFPAGSYLISTSPGIVHKAGVTLAGAGMDATTLLQAWWPGIFEGFVSSEGTYAGTDLTTLTADATPGAQTLTLTSTSGITAGDFLLLGADRAFGNAVVSASNDHLRYVGEIVQIKSVDSGTQVTIRGYVQDSYATADAASVRAITYLDGFGMRDMRLRNSAPLTATSSLLEMRYVRGFRIDRVHFDASDGEGVNLDMCREGSISDCRFTDFADDPGSNRYGYGINFRRATENVVVDSCTFRRLRHAVTTNGINNKRGVPRNIVISDCTAEWMTNAAYDTHAQGSNILFDGCVANNCDSHGFQIRSQDTKVIGGSVSYALNGVLFGLEADGCEARGMVIRKIIRPGSSGGFGFLLTGARHVTIAGNKVNGTTRQSVMVQAGSDYTIVTRNELLNPGVDGTPRQAVATNGTDAITGLRVINNLCGAFTTASDDQFTTGNMNNAVSLGSGSTGARVTDNRAFGLSSSMVSDSGTGTISRRNLTIDTDPDYLIAAGSNTAPSLAVAGDLDTGIYQDSADTLSVATGGGQRGQFHNNGLRVSSGSASIPSLAFLADSDVGLFRKAADEMGFTAGGTERASLSANGLALPTPLGAGVAGAAPTRLVRKTADESVTSSTTLQDDDELGFPIAANEAWFFEIVVFYNAGVTGDIKFAFTVPASATLRWGAVALTQGATSSVGSTQAQARDASGTSTSYGGAGADAIAILRGYVAAAATAGTVQLRWAQNTGDATPSTVQAGSYLTAQRAV